MKQTFLLANVKPYEEVKFECELNKKTGLTFKRLKGEEVDWRYVMMAATHLLKKLRIPCKRPYFFEDTYVIIPDNKIDVRYIPVLMGRTTKMLTTLPFTVDDHIILEETFNMPINLVIKTALALSMSYGVQVLETDSYKLNATLDDFDFKLKVVENEGM